MFARSTTIQGEPSQLDAGIAYVRDDVYPMLQHMDGCLGLSLMVDREQGTCIATTSWQDEEALHGSFEDLAAVRSRATEIMGGKRQVEEWEIAAMHRDHLSAPGSCARAVWLRTNQTDLDHGIGIYRDVLLPMLRELPGFCSASLLVNRDTQRACATTSFASMETMAASREQAWAIRERGVRDAGVDVIDAAEFELVMAHLRVPSLV
ncbi:antibiotic biosynthesis monooxygenase [Nocardioides cavernaquae]|uniref:ABM domain-containing protein n=1 Tax=Nocardioides cavernaquae TaxID=2321396 RepID=A0A3A5H9V4_9ACTN|nr:antibiotic biosynthesis monooxygenase [Nocardioides cavernaquae]RJS47403.1 hypothetical protein D4739_15065 [Nocardioides cavernaquae]